MPAEILGLEGDVLSLRISGRLSQQHLASAQAGTAKLIAGRPRIRILALVENFSGWEDGDWNNFSFQEAYDARIERMAIVGAEQWRDLALLFTAQGLRPFPIEYFPASQLAKAKAWLTSGPTSPGN